MPFTLRRMSSGIGRLSVRIALCVSFTALTTDCAREQQEPEPAPTQLQVGNVRAFVVKAPLKAGRVLGNLALEGPQLGIELRASGTNQERGALVAVRHLESAQTWESLRALIAIDGVLIEPSVQRMLIVKVGGRPALEVDALIETPVDTRRGQQATRIAVRRIFRLADVPGVARISTMVRVTRGAMPRDLKIIERVGWGGGIPIAPLSGPISAAVEVNADWVGRTLERRALVVAALDGEARVIGHSMDHGRVDLLRSTDLSLPLHKENEKTFSAEAVLSESNEGLAKAVRQLGWVRVKPFIEAVAILSTNPPETEVQVVLPSNGQLVMSGLPDERLRVILPLPTAVGGKPLLVGARARGVEASEWLPLGSPPYVPLMLTVPESSTLVVRVRHAGTGEPLPARIRVLPRRNTRVPNLGPDWEAKGALDTIISASGRASIRLAAGYYRVIVTHGPEWSVFDDSIELDVGKAEEVHAELERAIDPGSWIPCELHVHSAPSMDSQVTLEDRVASLVAEGIAFAVPTDHNHVTDLSNAIRAQPVTGLISVPGVEVTTDEPIFGHFNAYPYPLDPSLPGQGAPEYRGRQPGELFAALHALSPDLMVQVNHPRIEGGIGYFSVAEYDSVTDQGGALWSSDFDALEVWNGFDLARWQNVQTVLDDWLALNAHGHRIIATGSSDSHTIRSEGAGYPRTYVRMPLGGVGIDPLELVRSLRAGRAFVTSGPFLNVRIGDKTLGDAVELAEPNTRIDLDVFVQVAAWMQVSTLRVYLGGKVLRTMALGPPTATTAISRRYQRTLRLLIDQPGPLVVAVEGEATLDPIIARRGVKPFAFTNPIWLVRPGELPPRTAALPVIAPPLAPARADAGDRSRDAALIELEHRHAPHTHDAQIHDAHTHEH